MINLCGFFLGYGGFFKEVIRERQANFLAKIIRVVTLSQIFVMYLMQSTWASPNGYSFTYPEAQMYFWGEVIFSTTFACVITMCMEFPYYRLYSLFILPYITHDNLLQKWHDEIMSQTQPPEDEDKYDYSRPTLENSLHLTENANQFKPLTESATSGNRESNSRGYSGN